MRNIAQYKKIFYLILAVTIYNLFFINKAFHIDDPFTIKIAKAISQNSINQIRIPRHNPILLGYYYAPVIRFFGESEIWMHIFYLPFCLLVIVSMFILSLRFTKGSLLPVLSLVISPAFLIMSHSIMLDIPLLGFFLSALAAFIYGTDKNDNRLLFLSGVLAGIAILIKYSGLMLIPLMFFYALLSSKKRYCLFLLIPISMFFCNFMFYKDIPLIGAIKTRVGTWSMKEIIIRIFACLSFISGTSISGIFLIPFFLRNKNNLFLFFLSLPIGLCPFLVKGIFADYSYSDKLFLSLLFVSSFFIILTIYKTSCPISFKKIYNKDRFFLSLWFLTLLIFNVLAQFITARFVLLLFPPMFLISYGEIISSETYLLSGFKKLVVFAILFTFLLSTILAIGDYYFAGIYRDFLRYLKKEIPAYKKIYSCDASYLRRYAWGYSYYLNRYYGSPIKGLDIINSPGKMHYIFITPSEPVLPFVIEKKSIPEDFNDPKFDKVLIQKFSHAFLHNRKYRAGFYSHDWGLLPFKITMQRSILEKFYIYNLKPSCEINQ